MGLFRRVFGYRPPRRGVVVGDDEFTFRVVGSSHHQNAIERLSGGRYRTAAHLYCASLLTPQPLNPYDRHAVAVTIRGYEVGHLDREAAVEFLLALRAGNYADAACEAMIVGGWDRGSDDRGYFGVRLNARLPFMISPAAAYRAKQ